MYKDLTLEAFIQETASSAPVPGGGSVASLTGALASGLSAMVANLTVGKKKYEAHESAMQAVLENLGPKHGRFLALIDEDSKAFDLVMKALKMPKDTDEEKKVRTDFLQSTLKGAAEAPLEIALLAESLFDDIEFLVANGNANAQTDALVAAMLARTSILSALYNVKINLLSIKDEAYVQAMSKKVEALEKTAHEREGTILSLSSL